MKQRNFKPGALVRINRDILPRSLLISIGDADSGTIASISGERVYVEIPGRGLAWLNASVLLPVQADLFGEVMA